ncbi:MAG: FtsW/RodA/SpoVE family cell cycle protein [Pseudomonadota bacterium]
MSAFGRTDDSILANWWWTIDRQLLVVLALVAAIGIVFVFTASPSVAALKGLSPWHFAVRQCVFLALGIVVLLMASLLAPLGVRRFGTGLFAIALTLLVLVPLVGTEVNGATRWLVVGGFSIQPSELMKPALIVVVAHLLASRDGLTGLPAAVLPVALVVALLLLQPDVGTALLVTAVFCVMVFVAGLPWPLVSLLGAASVGVAALAYRAFGHVRDRIDAFLADEASFQVSRALEAVGGGGWFGRGPGEGLVKNRLPDSHADFIFAAGVEEFGLIVGLVLVMLFAVVVIRGLVLADQQPDRFAHLAAVGLLAQFGLQAVINLGVNVALLPAKGMTLPFVSYGGSSLLALAFGTGMALALLRRSPRMVLVR